MNDPILEKCYIDLLRSSGLSLETKKPSKEQMNRILKDMIKTAKSEGKDGLLLANEFVKAKVHEGDTNATQINREGYNTLISDICKEFERGLRVMGLSLPNPIFAGEFPTGIFNAQACLANGGALLLINTGTFDLIYRIAKLHALSIEVSGGDSAKKWPKAHYNKHRIASLFKNCLLSYLTYDNVQLSGYIPLAGGYRTLMLMNFVYDCERFVIAHELGHVVNGDLKEDKLKLVMRCIPCGQMELVMKCQKQEYAADLFGIRLLLHLLPLDFLPKAEDNPNMRYIKAISAVSAPLFFFALDSIIIEAKTALLGYSYEYYLSDHPDPQNRIKNIEKEYHDLELPEYIISEAEKTVDWILQTGKSAIEIMS